MNQYNVTAGKFDGDHLNIKYSNLFKNAGDAIEDARKYLSHPFCYIEFRGNEYYEADWPILKAGNPVLMPGKYYGYQGPKHDNDDRQRIDDKGDRYVVYDADLQRDVLTIKKLVGHDDVNEVYQELISAYQAGVRAGKDAALNALSPLIDELKV